MIDLKEYHHLVVARYAIVAIETYEEVRLIQYFHSLFKDREIYTWSVTEGLAKESVDEENHESVPFKDTEDYNAVLKWIHDASKKEPDKKRIFILKDFHPSMDSAVIRRGLRDLASLLPMTATSIFLVSPQIKIPSDLEKAVTLVDFPLPSEDEMIRMVKASMFNNAHMLKGKKIGDDRIREIARSCLGLTNYEADCVMAKSLVKHKDYVLREIADEKKQIIRKSGVLEIYDPDVALKDLGGMEELKDYLAQVKVQADDPKAKDFGLPAPKGILLLSPPGNGKSALAKAIAQDRDLTLVKFDFGAMLGSLVGESEGNMRKSFSRIESINRCVCWVDEIEKAFPGKDTGGGDSGTSKRMLGMMLTFMQERKGEGYFVATANSIANLPPELLRAGRFDSVWFIDLPSPEQREQILKIHLKKRGRDWGSSEGLDEVTKATDGYSGAELEQAVINGLRIAFYKKRDAENKSLYGDIIEAVSKMRPISVTMAEDIEQLRTWAKGRAQMASKAETVKRQLSGARRVT